MRLSMVLLVLPALLAAGCGSSGSEATAESDDRGEGDFCAQMLEMAATTDAAADDDPEAAREGAAQIRKLAASAPSEVSEALEVFAVMLDQFAEAGSSGDDLDALSEMMELVFSPEVLTAAQTLSDYMIEECGMDPAEAAEQFGVGGMSGEPDVSIPEGDDQFPDVDDGVQEPTDPSDISLDDMDAIKDAHEGEVWGEKIFSTSISNDKAISLGAAATEEEFGDGPLTVEEAVQACEAVRTALEGRQPQLTIEILNGEAVVAQGGAGVPCTAT